MRVRKKKTQPVEADLTPMIDMTFQLIAFFMVLINFAQTEDDARVVLPESSLAQPNKVERPHEVILHMGEEGLVSLHGKIHEVTEDDLGVFLGSERELIELKDVPIAEAVVVVRAHEDAPSGKVQELINLCQDEQFKSFALRAKQSKPEF